MTELMTAAHSARVRADAATLLITNADLVDHTGRRSGWLAAGPESILATGEGTPSRAEFPRADVVNADGRVVSPGLLDLHSHGGGGGSFDGPEDGVRAALAASATHGVTRSLLSLVSGSQEHLERQSGTIAAMAASAGTGDDPAAGILGLHLEGPFLSHLYPGAHAPEQLRAPSPEAVRSILDAAPGVLRYLTLAPELPGALDAVSALTEAGVTVGIGHTDADYPTVMRAFEAGATVLTHAFNARRGIRHRAPGPVLAALDAGATIELILDNIHVKKAVARMLARQAGDKLALITDSMAAAGIADGNYLLGDMGIEVTDGVARVWGSNRIAGSTLTQDQAVGHALELGLDLPRAIGAATHVPARVLGMAGLFGTLAPGFAADLVIWDEGLAPMRVWRDGVELPRPPAVSRTIAS